MKFSQIRSNFAVKNDHLPIRPRVRFAAIDMQPELISSMGDEKRICTLQRIESLRRFHELLDGISRMEKLAAPSGCSG